MLTPMLTVSGGLSCPSRNARSTRCAIRFAIPGSASISTTANSSPPYRAARSVARECSLIISDSLLSARFPTRWPYLSLIAFNSSRSRRSSENVVAALGPAHFTLQRIHEFAVIGQPRQCIVCRFVTDLILALLSFCNVDARGDATFDFTGRRAQRAEMNGKMMVAVLILEIRGDTTYRFVMLPDGSRVRILAFQVV